MRWLCKLALLWMIWLEAVDEEDELLPVLAATAATMLELKWSGGNGRIGGGGVSGAGMPGGVRWREELREDEAPGGW